MDLQEQRSKDPNAKIFIESRGRISENLNLDWSRIYSTFNNDDFSALPHEQPTYINIKSSQLHLIAVKPPFMPYIDAVKWELDHAKLKSEFSMITLAFLWPRLDLKFLPRLTLSVPRNSY